MREVHSQLPIGAMEFKDMEKTNFPGNSLQGPLEIESELKAFTIILCV